jgi:hypothetical protein
MNGFKFLSVVRRRLPSIPVIVLFGEFCGLTLPESVSADAFFAEGEYEREELFEKITSFLEDVSLMPKRGTSNKAAIWVKCDKGT